jgi:drug/metabolite transporter (DMT)-like permease
MTESPAANRTGYVYAAITILIWAGFVVVSRIGGKGSLTPYDIAALRTGTAALALSPWWLPRLFKPSLRQLRWGQSVSFALLAGIAYPLLAYSGFFWAPASHGAVLVSGLLPFFTTLLVWILLRERPNSLLALGLVAVGIFTLLRESFSNSAQHANASAWVGDLLFVGASLMWGLFTVLLKRWQVRAFDVTLSVVATSALIYLPVYALLLPKHILQAPLHEIALQAFFQGIVVVCCAMLTYTKAAEHLGAVRLAMLMALVPAVGTLLAVAILGEPLTLYVALGVALVSAGALLRVLR